MQGDTVDSPQVSIAMQVQEPSVIMQGNNVDSPEVSIAMQVQELTVSMQQCTAELDVAVNNGRTANEQLQKLRGEASVLQLWQQNVQAERAAEIETVRAAKQVSDM
jgi:hypothetical protein